MLRRGVTFHVAAAYSTGSQFMNRAPAGGGDSSNAAATARAMPRNAPPLPTVKMPATSRECFEMLALAPSTRANQYNEADIKSAYLKRAREAHPDAERGSDHEFRCVKAAYEYLRVRPGCVAADSEALNADGTKKPAAGFYDHPHAEGHRPTPRADRWETTRTRQNEPQEHTFRDEFRDFVNGYSRAADRQQRAAYYRQRRSEWRRRAGEECGPGATPQEQQQSRERWWSNRLFFWSRLGGTLLVLYSCHYVFQITQKAIAAAEALQQGNAYPEEYIRYIDRRVPDSFTSLDGQRYRTEAERHAANTAHIASEEARRQFMAKAEADLPRSQRSHALRYKGEPFTADGVRRASAKKKQHDADAATGGIAFLADATPGVLVVDPQAVAGHNAAVMARHPQQKKHAGPPSTKSIVVGGLLHAPSSNETDAESVSSYDFE